MSQDTFTKYVGVDWSGASGPYLKKLQVAVCEPGKSLPQLLLPSKGKYWRRDDLVNWIIKEAQHSRLLVGMDFGFAYPYLDKSVYFPEHPKSPKSVKVLWKNIDHICRHDPNFHAGPWYKERASIFSEYFCYQSYKGAYFDNNRLRKTEEICKLIGTRPTCLFKFVGADQIGSGSASGMRVLHYLATNHSDRISIWPFDNVCQEKSVIVEIFPRLFFTLSGIDNQQWNNVNMVNNVLKYYDSELLTKGDILGSEDKVDAIVSAAAIRNLSSHVDVWHPQNMDENARQYEGWIFGCR